jgi:hypothetical protein
MNNKIKDLFGIRVYNFIIDYCKNELNIEQNINAFEGYYKNLSVENKQILISNMKIYQLQMYSIQNNIWKNFSDYIMSKKRKRNIEFQDMIMPKKVERFTYNSKFYKMTEFRLILQEHLIKKKMNIDLEIEEKTYQSLRSKIFEISNIYKERKRLNPESFNDVIGPDIMKTLTPEEQYKTVKMLNHTPNK